jgi:hypothetical protein
MKAITLPTVHMNGTSLNELKAGYDEAAEKLHEFVQSWGHITCNGRDYYPQGAAAFSKACDERDAIGRQIANVGEYLQEIRLHLHSL